jgi:menaquinone-9 beta-reductase
MTSEFDVIICGAGPAGCTAALALGSSGLKVALIEKERFPREKVCGDAIPAYIPKILNTINPEYSRAFEGIIEKKTADICRIVSPGRKVLELRFPESGYICRRLIFDTFLFDLVNQLQDIAIFQETLVKTVTVSNNEVIAFTDKELSLKAKVAIGCDGAHSIIQKKLAVINNDIDEGFVAVRTYFRNIKDTSPGTIELHFLKELLTGYFWIFSLPQNLFNVGLGIPLKIISEKKINIRNELVRIIETDHFLSQRFSEAEMTSEIKGHFLPISTGKIPISGNHFMLCGDAASLANPATGAGIGQAMQSGRYAGWQALKCFDKNDFSANYIKNYDNIVRDKLRKENRQYLLMRELILKNAWIFDRFIYAGQKSKSVNKMIARLLG